MTHKLLVDVYSNFKQGKDKVLLAKRGELVKIVWMSLPAVVVQGKHLFTVNENMIQKIT